MFKMNDKDILHSFGEETEYFAKICGVASILPECIFYIIECIDYLKKKSSEYTKMVVSEHYLRKNN